MNKFALTTAIALIAAAPAGVMAKPKPATAPATVEEVVGKIKADLAKFNEEAAADDAKRAVTAPAANDCRANVKIDVTSIAVSLKTVTERSGGGSISAEVPIGPVKVGGSGSGSRSTKQSQTLKFRLVPVKDELTAMQKSEPEIGFADVLRQLRTSLIKAGGAAPCLTFLPKDKQDNSVEFGFELTRNKSSGFKLSFLIFSIGAERKKKDDNINIITVNFTMEGQLK